MRKLTDTEVRLIRFMVAWGVPINTIAKAIDMGYANVYRVARGHAYKDVK